MSVCWKYNNWQKTTLNVCHLQVHVVQLCKSSSLREVCVNVLVVLGPIILVQNFVGLPDPEPRPHKDKLRPNHKLILLFHIKRIIATIHTQLVYWKSVNNAFCSRVERFYNVGPIVTAFPELYQNNALTARVVHALHNLLILLWLLLQNVWFLHSTVAQKIE